MSDELARAVGAKSAMIQIGGKECTVRPLSIRELLEIERECIKSYRREFLTTFSENMDLLPKEVRDKVMIEKMNEAGRWDVDDLPKKYIYDARKINLTPELKAWLISNYGAMAEDEEVAKRLVVSSMNQMELSEQEYKELAGTIPTKLEVGYANWWITEDKEGQVVFIWMAIKHNNITKDKLLEAISENPSLLYEISSEVHMVSASKLGN